MKARTSRISWIAVALAVAGWLAAAPARAQQSGSRGGGESGGGARGGTAVASGGGAATSSGGTSAGSSAGGGSTTASGGNSTSSPGNMSGGATGTGGGAVARQPLGTDSSSGGSATGGGSTIGRAEPRGAGVRTGGDGGAGYVPPNSRPRGDKPATGTAVPRTGPPPATGNYPIYGYPWWVWGYGGLGYYGYYDPWWGDPWDYGGGYGGGYQPATNYSGEEGSVRLKVKPSAAEVYVDGYFTGHVDDYDGFFQRLHLPTGPHHLELRADGYEPLVFDIRVEENQTLTFKGELKKLP